MSPISLPPQVNASLEPRQVDEATWPGWQRVCEPVAKAITKALSAAMRAQIADLPEEMSGMSEQIDAISSLVGNMSKAACAMQVGYAVGR